MNVRKMKRLIGVDVANPGETRLVKERGLHRPTERFQRRAEGASRDRERVGAQARPSKIMQIGKRIKGPKPPESPRITKGEKHGSSVTRLDGPARVNMRVFEWS